MNSTSVYADDEIYSELRSDITIKVRLNDDPECCMELMADENDTFNEVAMRIPEAVLAGESKFGLFYRNKTLDLKHTLKQEKFESGETLDVKTYPKYLNQPVLRGSSPDIYSELAAENSGPSTIPL